MMGFMCSHNNIINKSKHKKNYCLYKINDDKLNSQINLKLRVKESKHLRKTFIDKVLRPLSFL